MRLDMRLRSTILAAGITAALPSALLAEDLVSIVEIAPAGTFLVVGADDIDATCKHFEATPLAGLMKSEAVQPACDRGVRQLAAQEQVVAQAGLE